MLVPLATSRWEPRGKAAYHHGHFASRGFPSPERVFSFPLIADARFGSLMVRADRLDPGLHLVRNIGAALELTVQIVVLVAACASKATSL